MCKESGHSRPVARAMLRPSRPFAVKTLRKANGMGFLNTTRRLGAFYVLAGLIWVGISLLTPQMS